MEAVRAAVCVSFPVTVFPGTMLVGKGAELKPAGISGHPFLATLLIRSTYMIPP